MACVLVEGRLELIDAFDIGEGSARARADLAKPRDRLRQVAVRINDLDSRNAQEHNQAGGGHPAAGGVRDQPSHELSVIDGMRWDSSCGSAAMRVGLAHGLAGFDAKAVVADWCRAPGLIAPDANLDQPAAFGALLGARLDLGDHESDCAPMASWRKSSPTRRPSEVVIGAFSV